MITNSISRFALTQIFLDRTRMDEVTTTYMVKAGGYRYGYQGSERDDEVKGTGNSYTTEFRQYDPRIGRWLSIDPLMRKYPGQSPYVGMNDNPIMFFDPDGKEGQGDYFDAVTREYLGTDGIKDGLEHLVDRKDFESVTSNDIWKNQHPDYKKQGLSSIVKVTLYNYEISNSIGRKGTEKSEAEKSVAIYGLVGAPNKAQQTDVLSAVAETGKYASAAEGVLKYKEFDITLTEKDVKALKGGKLILSKVSTAGDIINMAETAGDMWVNGFTSDNIKDAAMIMTDMAADRALTSGVPVVMLIGGAYYIVKFMATSMSGPTEGPSPATIQWWFENRDKDNTRIGDGYGF